MGEWLNYKPGIRASVLEKTHGYCWYCGELLQSNWQIDHISARSGGRDDALENLVPACLRCNCRKKDFCVEEFRMREQARLGLSSYVFYFERVRASVCEVASG